MEITGTVEGKDQEFTVEIDSSDLWQEISDSVEECASEAISNYMDYYEHDVDFTDGASNLLREYNPGTGCSLAREFEEAVKGAVTVDDFLVNAVKETLATVPVRGVDAMDALLLEPEIRKVVRSEVRMALATALGTLTNGEEE